MKFLHGLAVVVGVQSPSVRRVLVEIPFSAIALPTPASPSVRRVLVEIQIYGICKGVLDVTLREEGVG